MGDEVGDQKITNRRNRGQLTGIGNIRLFNKGIMAIDRHGNEFFKYNNGKEILKIPLINSRENATINGGVYMGTQSGREAIYVNDEYLSQNESEVEDVDDLIEGYAENYNECYEGMKAKLRKEEDGSIDKGSILPAIFAQVKESIPKRDDDLKMTEDLIRAKFNLEDGNFPEDQLINLGVFIRHGVGLCRHKVLLIGYLLERFKKDNSISEQDKPQGSFRIMRSNAPNKGSHAWVEYKNSRGEIIIMDPQLDYSGPINTIEASKVWDYKPVKR